MMKLLLTGAFGNIGSITLVELLKRGHQVRCFDVKTSTNRRLAWRLKRESAIEDYPGSFEIMWGDLRHLEDVTTAVQKQEAVIHLGFVIPSLSATGVSSEAEPEWARIINVGGTRNLLLAMADQQVRPKILFASSLHIYGRTHDRKPPLTVDDPPQPIEHYAKHKVQCEELVKSSGLVWAIFRLGAALPVRLILDPDMFKVPLDNRIEFVHRLDVGLAIANALENDQVWGHTWLIGGGPCCQLYQRDIVNGVLEAVGVGMLPDEAFTTVPFPTDWLDTSRSQQLLHFQRHTLQDYIQEVRAQIGIFYHVVRILRPLIRHWLLKKSSTLIQTHG